MARRAARWRSAAPVALVAAVLAACSTPDPSTMPTTTAPAPTHTLVPPPTLMTATTTRGPTATTTGSPTATATDPPSVATLEGGNGLARRLVLDGSFLPPGWTDATPRDSGGYRMSVCGVDLEPNSPVDGAQRRWQASRSGPYLEQHVRVYADGTAADVVAGLARALPSCTGYTATDSAGGSSSYTVQPLSLRSASERTVAWRQRLVPPPTAAASASPGARVTSAPAAPVPPVRLVQDVALSRVGSSVVLLAAYAVNATPDGAVLAAALEAALARGR